MGNIKALTGFIAIVAVIPHCHSSVPTTARLDSKTDEQRIVDRVLTNYNRHVRPVINISETVVVYIGLNLIQIFDLDEKNQILVAHCWLDLEWKDDYIRWDPRDFSNLTTIRLFSHSIWIPDIVLYNNGEVYKTQQTPSRAMVEHTGLIFYPTPEKIISSCKIDVTYFPFDEQLCLLKYGSWSYNGWRVDITNRTASIDMSNFMPNGEWNVVSVNHKKHLVFYSCCPEPYADITFYIHLRRKTLYYFINVFFPSSVMCAMTSMTLLNLKRAKVSKIHRAKREQLVQKRAKTAAKDQKHVQIGEKKIKR